MRTAWPLVPLGQVLTQDRDYITELEPRLYKKLSVKLYGRGVVLDTPTDATTVKMERHQMAKAGQMILSEIWGKKGAVGLVPPDGEGALVTSHFFLFDIDENAVTREYIGWVLKGNYLESQLNIEARGTTGYAAVRPKHLLSAVIPLPPLLEQRRIVARIEELSAKIEEARGLRQEATDEVGVTIQRASSRLLDEADWEMHPLEALLAEPPRNGLAPQRAVETGGLPMLRINAVSSSTTRYVDVTARKMVDVDVSAFESYFVQEDDVFIVRYNGDLNRVGKAAIFKNSSNDKIIYPDKLMRLRPNRAKMIPDFLVYALGSRRVREQIEGLGKTTAGQIGISGGDAKSFEVPVPPVAEQQRIVSYLDALQAKVDSLNKLQAETAAELDVLLPSVLDQAFSGNL